MNVKATTTLRDYVAYLKGSPDEAEALLKDLLISVTNFFRDHDAFAALERDIIPTIFEKKNSTRLCAYLGRGLCNG